MQHELWKIPNDWFASWFNTPAYHQLYGPRDQDEANDLVDRLVVDVIPDELDGPMLECACGGGRHALRFAQNGLLVKGMDLAANSIQQAKEMAGNAQIPEQRLQFFVGDMRKGSDVMRHAPFDVITLLFTSFGYFQTDEEHEQTLSNFYDGLSSKGMLILDFLNVDQVRSHLVSHEVVERGPMTFELWRRIHKGWIEKAIRYEAKGSEELHHERVRAFHRDDLVRMASRFGFHLHSCFGDYGLGDWHGESPRTLLIFEK